MLNITLDKETAAKLREPKQAAIVRDADGNLLGVFECMAPAAAELYQLALDTANTEQLKHCSDPSRGSYTWEQVKQHLRELEQQECASP